MTNLSQHFYINLDNRKERNLQTIQELKKIGIKKPNRVSAITHDIPLIGCACSHIKCLEEAKSRKWNYVIIFEDDIVIEHKKTLLKKIDKYIMTEYDVLYLGVWNVEKPILCDGGALRGDDLIKVTKGLCTHAYIVKEHYYDTLISNLKQGISEKLKNDCESNNIDQYLESLQKRDHWISIYPIHVTQRDGFSDNFNEQRNLSEIIKKVPI